MCGRKNSEYKTFDVQNHLKRIINIKKTLYDFAKQSYALQEEHILEIESDLHGH